MNDNTASKLVFTRIDEPEKNGWLIYEDGLNARWVYIKDTKGGSKREGIFSSSVANFLKQVFLPQGFPDSVHPDYVPYQIWDTVQAFASTILGTLTTHSIMRGVGVGESTATPLAAAITWILKDGTGMIGRILFAWWNGPELDAQCKKWRLFADIINDLAMGVELTLPLLSNYSTILLCISSAMKSLVGVAGGATRAAITQHQALKNNLADVSAKDGSQETCVNLIASLLGVFMLSTLDASSRVLFWYMALVTIHIYANYRAVRSLCFNTLNEDRLAILCSNYLTGSRILSPVDVNQLESVSVFHRASKELCGFDIVIGQSPTKYLETAKSQHEETAIIMKSLRSFNLANSTNMNFEDAVESLNVILPDVKNRIIYVALYHRARSNDIANAYFEAFLRGVYLSIHLNLRPDIVRGAKTTSGPLSTLNEIANELRETKTGRIDVADEFIDREITKWNKLLDINGWTKETNLLSVGPYRSYADPTVLNR